jgi:hypothetical protein
VLLPLAAALAVALPTTPGNIGAAVVLGLLGLLGSIGVLAMLTARRRRPLLARAWCRCPATVAADGESAAFDRVIVFDGDRSLVLRGTLPDVSSLLLQADRDEPPEEPQPWLLRGIDPGPREITALRR